MRFIITASLFTLAACQSESPEQPDVNVYVDINLPEEEADADVPMDDTGDTGEFAEEDVVYYVPDLSDQVVESDTRLEFVDGYHLTITSSNPDLGSDLDCMVTELRVPDDASQGVIINHIEWGAYGLDTEQTGWMDHMSSVGHGSNVLVLGDIQLFLDPDDMNGTELVYETWQYDPISRWSSMFGCLSDSCDETAFGANPGYYVPVGTVSIGFCTAWSKDWDNPDAVPSNQDWHYSVLSKIWWTPADTRDFDSGSIHGLPLPVSSVAMD